MKKLGRRLPSDWKHIEKYPLTLSTTPDKPTPIVVGINWYTNFDKPEVDFDGKYWIGKKSLGTIRGGHCVCMPNDYEKDTKTLYSFYDQGKEGACVGFGSSRAMSLLNNKRKYDALWLWNEAKKIDEWNNTNPGDNNGTSVRAAMDVLRTIGHKRLKGKPSLEDGIVANRWATNIDDLFSVLKNPSYEKLGAIPFLNSWGKSYPEVVWMPCEIWDKLIKEEGEFTMITDK